MRALVSILVPLLVGQVGSDDSARLSVRAERGLGGVQSDGWQHIALRIENESGEPVRGRATLYEWESEIGARPRIVIPFQVTDRLITHFYPFRPVQSPQPTSFVITLEDESGRPIPFSGGNQLVIRGRPAAVVMVDMGSPPFGQFRVAVWGDRTPFLRTFIHEWTPPVNELLGRSHAITSAQWQKLAANAQATSEAVAIEDARMLPDSYLGYGDLRVFMAVGTDFDQAISEPQRRALDEWVRSGGTLIIMPTSPHSLAGPFLTNLIGIRNRGEVTAESDSHLKLDSDAGPAHRIHHFLTDIHPPRPIDLLASYESHPVVYAAPAGYGLVWVIGFDPEAHGGVGRYKSIWREILNRTLVREVTGGISPAGLAAQPWDAGIDRRWLSTLSEPFGEFPAIEHLAVVVLCYLLVVGPVNFALLKRRDVRVWLIGTVPVLAVCFGGAILTMGYLSHGFRSASNYLATGVVTAEGGHVFVNEYIGVYGTTSAEYRLEFPKGLGVRPLGEFVPNAGGGFDFPGSFKLDVQNARQTLRDWRLTFWQTRGVATTDCIPLGGHLTARRHDDEIVISNQTEINFEMLFLASAAGQSLGSSAAYETVTLELGPMDADAAARGDATRTVLKRRSTRADGSQSFDLLDSSSVEDELEAETLALLDSAASQVVAWGGVDRTDWIFGVTRETAHAVSSPDVWRRLTGSVYALPVLPRDSDQSKR